MAKVAFFSHRPLFEEGILTGASQRIVEIAKALKRKGHTVVLSQPGDPIDNFALPCVARDDLINDIERFDLCFVQVWDHDTRFLNHLRKVPVIVDVYAPLLLQIGHFLTQRKSTRFIQEIILPFIRLIHRGDYFVCASNEQKEYFLSLLSALRKISPLTYDESRVIVVPTAPQHEPSKKKGRVLRGKIPGHKKIILFPSGIYPWVDYHIAIDAAFELSQSRNDFVLVFVGHTLDTPTSKQRKEEAIEYAKKLDLLDSVVFFYDSIPYEDRATMYAESSFALLTYKMDASINIAYRTRIVDCLWGKCPVVCTKGDVLSQVIALQKLGRVISQDFLKIVSVLNELLDSPEQLTGFQRNIKQYLKATFNWDQVIQPIHQFCKEPTRAEHTLLSSPLNRRQDELANSIATHLQKIPSEDLLTPSMSEQYYAGELSKRRKEVEQLKEKRDQELSVLLKRHEEEIVKREKMVDSLHMTIHNLHRSHAEEKELMRKEHRRLGEALKQQKELIENLTHNISELKDLVVLQQNKEKEKDTSLLDRDARILRLESRLRSILRSSSYKFHRKMRKLFG